MTYVLLYMFVMPEKQETLAEFVGRIMAEKNLSFRKVAERSGRRVSHSTVADIANGLRPDVRKDTLMALAKGLAVPAEDLFRVAGGFTTERPTERFEIYAERFDAKDFTDTEWQLLESYFNDHVQKWKAAKEQREKDIENFLKQDKKKSR